MGDARSWSAFKRQSMISARSVARTTTGLFVFSTSNTLATVHVMRPLIPHLGPVKREQLRTCAKTTLAALGSMRRPGGPSGHVRAQIVDCLNALVDEITSSGAEAPLSTQERLAWAAGLFDGDGSTHMSRTRTEKSTYEILRATVSQNSSDGTPAVLTRFRDIVGFGCIYGPYHRRAGCLPEYQWVASRSSDVARLIEMLAPNLSEAKRVQARNAFRSYVLEGVRRGMELAF